MKPVRTAAAVLLVLFAAACGSTQPGSPMDDVHKLRVGMFEDEAWDLLGAPQDTTTEADGSETWTYRYSESDEFGGDAVLLVHVRDGRVATWEERLGD